MIFDMAIDSHLAFPFTLQEALDDWSPGDQSLELQGNALRTGRSEKIFGIPTTPPSTPKGSFKLFDYTTHDKVRGGSISSNGSVPGMVEDNSRISDSDAEPSAEHDPYEESMARLWDTYETLFVENEASEAIMFHFPSHADEVQTLLPPSSCAVALPRDSRTQARVKSRSSKGVRGSQRSFIPVPTRSHPRFKTSHRRCVEAHEGQYIAIPDPLPVVQAPRLHRSAAQRSSRLAPDTLKPLPPSPPHKQGGSSLDSSSSKRSRSQLSVHQSPHRQHPSYTISPYPSHPALNPCNSSHAYSLHKTPPLPFPRQIEKSFFDYDTDDEDLLDSVNHLSSSLAKLHIRSFSLGGMFGRNGKKDGNKSAVDENGRRRSATEIVREVFGIAKK